MKKTTSSTAPRSGVHFDDAVMLVGSRWKDARLKAVTDKAAYALEIAGDSMLLAYRQGDTIVVSPGAAISKGDRVVVRTNDGQVMAKVLQKQTSRNIQLASFNPDLPIKSLDTKNVDWISRIIWASQ